MSELWYSTFLRDWQQGGNFEEGLNHVDGMNQWSNSRWGSAEGLKRMRKHGRITRGENSLSGSSFPKVSDSWALCSASRFSASACNSFLNLQSDQIEKEVNWRFEMSDITYLYVKSRHKITTKRRCETNHVCFAPLEALLMSAVCSWSRQRRSAGFRHGNAKHGKAFALSNKKCWNKSTQKVQWLFVRNYGKKWDEGNNSNKRGWKKVLKHHILQERRWKYLCKLETNVYLLAYHWNGNKSGPIFQNMVGKRNKKAIGQLTFGAMERRRRSDSPQRRMPDSESAGTRPKRAPHRPEFPRRMVKSSELPSSSPTDWKHTECRQKFASTNKNGKGMESLQQQCIKRSTRWMFDNFQLFRLISILSMGGATINLLFYHSQ